MAAHPTLLGTPPRRYTRHPSTASPPDLTLGRTRTADYHAFWSCSCSHCASLRTTLAGEGESHPHPSPVSIQEYEHLTEPADRPAEERAIAALPRRAFGTIAVRSGQMSCPVCQYELQTGEEVVLLPCRHLLHADECLEWLRYKDSCPLCRSSIGDRVGAGDQQLGDSFPALDDVERRFEQEEPAPHGQHQHPLVRLMQSIASHVSEAGMELFGGILTTQPAIPPSTDPRSSSVGEISSADVEGNVTAEYDGDEFPWYVVQHLGRQIGQLGL